LDNRVKSFYTINASSINSAKVLYTGNQENKFSTSSYKNGNGGWLSNIDKPKT
jgi:hypothetical protein